MFFAKSTVNTKSVTVSDEKKSVALDDITQEHEAIYGDLALMDMLAELHTLRDHGIEISQ